MRSRRWTTAELVLSLVGVAVWFFDPALAEAQQPKVGLQIDYKARELKAPPAIKAKLADYRAQIAKRKLSFEVGYTDALDRDPQHLLGTRAPANLVQLARQHNVLADKLLKADEQARTEFLKLHPKFELPGELIRRAIDLSGTHFDWRSKNKVTPVRDQMGCGSCWDFGALGAYEGSYLLRNITSATAYKTLDVSEQHVLNCSKAGSCAGGWHAGVFEYLIKHGACAEASLPYKGKDGTCDPSLPGTYRAVSWGYVKADARGIPTVKDMKDALKTHGPLVAAFEVTGPFFGYTKGVFKDYTTPADPAKIKINHDVTVIGWDDLKHAWIIKNSWGTGWGMDGFGYIDYDTNCFGYGAAWVHARSNFYVLPPRYFEIIPNILPHPKPLPFNLKPMDVIRPEILIRPTIKPIQLKEEESEVMANNSDCASAVVAPYLNGDNNKVVVLQSNNADRFAVAKGDEVVVKLPAQPGTGFTWNLMKHDKEFLEPLDKPFFEDAQGKKVGESQLQVFRFGVRQFGATRLELAYFRPFEKDAKPAKTFALQVEAREDGTITVTEADDAKSVNLPKGAFLMVKLPANPSTGFTWQIIKNDNNRLKPEGTPVFVATDPKLVGSPGHQMFRFQAAGAGAFSLAMNYARPFEKTEKPSQTFALNVTVR